MSEPAPRRYPLGLFDAYGIELEYMIVDRDTLDVAPIADALFRAAGGEGAGASGDLSLDGRVAWSNELALHVVELKTDGPAPRLDGLADVFQEHVQRVDALLEPLGARLLPTGMHPWMDPDRETRLWPHENNDIYRTYDRIFGCRGHGWSNLQSTHINLPFADDEEFGRLHAAIRIVLPILPALAASSPLIDGRLAENADQRLAVYRSNARLVPSVTGLVVPEPVFTTSGYHRDILERIYDDLAPLDPEGLLRHEFANARGCIARFDRGAIEIRVLDIQECPRADLAVVALVSGLVRALVEERWISYERQCEIDTARLHGVLLATITDAERAWISESAVLQALGLDPAEPRSVADVWSELVARVLPTDAPYAATARAIVDAGSLSTRIRARLRGAYRDRDAVRAVYAQLADCLAQGRLFDVPGDPGTG